MFLDANIFIEIALRDQHSPQCKSLIRELVEKGKPFYTSDFIVYSCLLIVQRKLQSPVLLRNFLVFLNSINIQILRPSFRIMHDAMDFMEKYRLDFDDALVVSCMIKNNIQQLVSYDHHFEVVSEISVVRP